VDRASKGVGRSATHASVFLFGMLKDYMLALDFGKKVEEEMGK
jgi:hypothetical protein